MEKFIENNPNLTATSFHALRHAAATLMIKNNVPIPTVIGILGHAQMATTVNIYTHITEDTKKEALNILEASVTDKLTDKKAKNAL